MVCSFGPSNKERHVTGVLEKGEERRGGEGGGRKGGGGEEEKGGELRKMENDIKFVEYISGIEK